MLTVLILFLVDQVCCFEDVFDALIALACMLGWKDGMSVLLHFAYVLGN